MYGMNKIERKRMEQFLALKNQQVIDKQGFDFESHSDSDIVRQMVEDGIPYYGAIGGSYSIILTPTSMGIAYTIRFNYPGLEEEMSITDYTRW